MDSPPSHRAELAKLTCDESTRERELREAHRLFLEIGAPIRAAEVAKQLARTAFSYTLVAELASGCSPWSCARLTRPFAMFRRHAELPRSGDPAKCFRSCFEGGRDGTIHYGEQPPGSMSEIQSTPHH